MKTFSLSPIFGFLLLFLAAGTTFSQTLSYTITEWKKWSDAKSKVEVRLNSVLMDDDLDEDENPTSGYDTGTSPIVAISEAYCDGGILSRANAWAQTATYAIGNANSSAPIVQAIAQTEIELDTYDSGLQPPTYSVTAWGRTVGKCTSQMFATIDNPSSTKWARWKLEVQFVCSDYKTGGGFGYTSEPSQVGFEVIRTGQYNTHPESVSIKWDDTDEEWQTTGDVVTTAGGSPISANTIWQDGDNINATQIIYVEAPQTETWKFITWVGWWNNDSSWLEDYPNQYFSYTQDHARINADVSNYFYPNYCTVGYYMNSAVEINVLEVTEIDAP